MITESTYPLIFLRLNSISGPLRVEVISCNSVILRWAAPMNCREKMRYIIEKTNCYIKGWQMVGETDQLWANVNQLEATVRYKFRVRAINSFGISVPLESNDWVEMRSNTETKIIEKCNPNTRENCAPNAVPNRYYEKKDIQMTIEEDHNEDLKDLALINSLAKAHHANDD